TLINWYRTGVDVEREIPKLSTYLGHVHVNATYWYIEGVPELLPQLAWRPPQPRCRRASAHQAHHRRPGTLPVTTLQADHPTSASPHRRHATSAAWRGPIRHRALARPRIGGNHSDVSARRYTSERASARAHHTARASPWALPAGRQASGVPG